MEIPRLVRFLVVLLAPLHAICSMAEEPTTKIPTSEDDATRNAAEKALTDASPAVRLSAAESLKKIGDPRSLPALVLALQDENTGVANRAVHAIVALGDDSVVPPLLEVLGKSNRQLRTVVCAEIGRLRLQRPEIVSEALLPLIDDPDTQTRYAVMTSLGRLREKRAVPKLLQIAVEPLPTPKPSPNLLIPQMVALIALGEIGDPSVIPALLKLLDSPELGIFTVEALIKIGDASAAQPLFEHLDRTANNETLRRTHTKEAEALGKLGTAETRAQLEDFLTRCPPSKMSAIRSAILAINRKPAP